MAPAGLNSAAATDRYLGWLTDNETLVNNESLKTIVRITALIVIVSGSVFILMGMLGFSIST